MVIQSNFLFIWIKIYQHSVGDQFGIYSQISIYSKRINHDLFIVKDRAKWNLHCNFHSLILSSHTWNISRRCPSQIYKQWKSDWYASWKCFMYDNSKLSCWNFYNYLSFKMGHGLFFWNRSQFNTMVINGDNRQIIETSWNKYWFGDRSQFDLLPCNRRKFLSRYFSHS